MSARPVFGRIKEIGGSIAFVPSSRESDTAMRKLPRDRIIAARFRRPRNIRYHRLAHALGTMVVESIEGFGHLTAHDALKRLQIESGVACDSMQCRIDGKDAIVRVPRSLSFASMDQDDFEEVITGIAKYLLSEYWNDMSEEELWQLVDSLADLC